MVEEKKKKVELAPRLAQHLLLIAKLELAIHEGNHEEIQLIKKYWEKEHEDFTKILSYAESFLLARKKPKEELEILIKKLREFLGYED